MKIKKIIFFLMISIIINGFKEIIGREDFVVEWENTYLNLEVNSNLDDFADLPRATIYLNDQKLNCQITYFKGVDYTTLLLVKTSFCEEYKVIYQANFSLNNRVFYTHKREIFFNVTDTEPPVILENRALEIDYNQKDSIDYFEGIKLKDNYSESDKIIVTHEEIDLELGDNRINYRACDEKSNCLRFERVIRIIDTEKPKAFLLSNHLIIDIHQEYDLIRNVIAQDNTDEIFIKIRGEVRMDRIGLYPIIYVVADRYGNEIELECSVEVVDRIAPILIFESNLTIDYDKIDQMDTIILSSIREIIDNAEYLGPESIQIAHDFISPFFKREINVNFRCEDKSHNISEYQKIFYIINTPQPTLEFDNIIVSKYSKLELVKDIKAFDFMKRDITSKIKITENNIDISKSGDYTVKYAVEDDFLQRAEKIRLITVVNATNSNSNAGNGANLWTKASNFLEDYFTYILFGGIGSYFLVKYYLKKRESKKNML